MSSARVGKLNGKKEEKAVKYGLSLIIALVLFLAGCLPSASNSGGKGARTITIYGFSIVKEALEKEIYPAFTAKWKREKGEDVLFTSSFAGSEMITNQILQGASADIAILSIERDVDRLIAAGLVPGDCYVTPQNFCKNIIFYEQKTSSKQLIACAFPKQKPSASTDAKSDVENSVWQ